MSTAGLSDVYQYGVRFVGYLLVVSLVGGAFVAAGGALGADLIAATLGGGAASTATGTAVAAVALTAIGALLLLSGLFGLAHKLVADAALTGTRIALAETGTGSTDSEAGAEPAAEEAEPTGAAPVGAATADTETGSTDSADPAPAEAPVETGEPANRSDPADTDEGESTPSQAQSTTATDGADPSATGSEPSPSQATDDAVVDAAADATDDLPADETETSAGGPETQPEEWSPPDPSEFETAVPADDGDDGADGWDVSEVDPAEASEGPRTADDLFGEGETEPPEGDDPEDVSELFDEDGPDGSSGEDGAREDTATFDTDSDSDPLSDALDES